MFEGFWQKTLQAEDYTKPIMGIREIRLSF